MKAQCLMVALPRIFIALLLACSPLHAQTGIEWISVGDTGNPPDKSGFGAVAYDFQIMQHEVTCAQYAEFLNAIAATDPHGLWNPKMDGAPMPAGRDDIRTEQGCLIRTGESGSFKYAVVPGHERKPIVNVSFFAAMRYANWQHGGTTESGAYDLTKPGGLAVHSPEARVWLPTENEWHKAAYYDAAKQRYWRYATRSDDVPESRPPHPTHTNSANFFWDDRKNNGISAGLALAQSDYQKPGTICLTDVGSYPATRSAYGTLDQSGNVWEWTEGIVFETKRVIRGGSWMDEANAMRSTTRSNVSPDKTYSDVGFRLCRRLPQ